MITSSDKAFESLDTAPLRAAIEIGLARLGDKAAYHKLDARMEREASLSGATLRELAIALASDLGARAPSFRRVAIVTPSGPEFLVAMLACIYAGLECVAPPFPSPGPTKKRFEKIMTGCEPDCVLAAGEDIPDLTEELEAIGLEKTTMVAIGMSPSSLDLNEAFNKLPDRDCRILQYTSGTSGSPRAVVLTGANVAANAELTVRSWELTADDSMLTWLPHHHDMGLFGCIITPMVVGGPIHQMSPFTFLKRPSRWMEAVFHTRATLTGGPAFAMRLAIEARGSIDELDLSCVRGVFCGSEPIAPDLLERFAAHFKTAGLSPKAPFSCYGLAESTLYVAGRPGGGLTAACKIFDDSLHSVCIVDPHDRTLVQDGCEGEVWVAGPSVAETYLDAPDESTATFGGRLNGAQIANWLKTGDLGRIDGDALLVSGRIKDMIIVNGANVPAAEIEWTAINTDPVFDGMAACCFAYGALDEGRAALVVEVEKRAARDLEIDATCQRIRAAVRTAHSVDLTDIIIVRRGTMPRTTSGKVQRNLVRDMLAKGEMSGLETSNGQ